MARKRVAILISGRGSNMVALIEAAKDQTYPAEIALVVSNDPAAEGLEARGGRRHRDRRRRSPNIRQGPRGVRARAARRIAGAQDRARLPRRLHAAPDAVVRAAMGRTAAQHPSGAAAGLQGPRHPRARDCGRREEHGATVHFVVPEMDSGPIIAQARCRCAAATPKRRSPRACSRSSTASIRRRCGWWRKAACDRRWPLSSRRAADDSSLAARKAPMKIKTPARPRATGNTRKSELGSVTMQRHETLRVLGGRLAATVTSSYSTVGLH